ncbi:MAG: PIG-L family deacetylase, partial [Bdellovibrionaceae bacterium]|nr:PIG-L family deacetylase [Pseudobdellovibrionaceae bacterium]
MSKKKNARARARSYRLLVVSHPDDETLFFSGALLNSTDRPWVVICATNGNADGAGRERAKQFQAACKKLKVAQAIQLSFPDIYENRLDINELVEQLQQFSEPYEVYTHGIVGEYGHPHHQDISCAVHRFYGDRVKVWVPAYNCEADKTVKLDAAQYKLKSNIYAEIYKGETLRFANFLPNRTVDEYARLDLNEVEEVYASILEKRAPDIKSLKSTNGFTVFW